jgi:hypothetical protein
MSKKNNIKLVKLKTEIFFFINSNTFIINYLLFLITFNFNRLFVPQNDKYCMSF